MRKMMQRSLSCLLTLAMVVTMLMTSTLAAEKSAKLEFDYSANYDSSKVVSLEVYKGYPADSYAKEEEIFSQLEAITPQADGSYVVTAPGTYAYHVHGTGYYNILQLFNVTEADLTAGVKKLSVIGGKLGGNGFEPTIKPEKAPDSYKMDARDSMLIFWPEEINKHFALEPQNYTTPAFDGKHAANEFTSQEELMAFLKKMDAASGTMHLYSAGTTPNYKYDLPLALFTTSEIPANATLAEAAKIVKGNGKLNVWYQAQIHPNEPAAGEGALVMIDNFVNDPAYKALLDKINIVIVPRINPDGSYLFSRATYDGFDMNRDHMSLKAAELAQLHTAYRLFMSEVVLDTHEFTFYGAYNDDWTGAGEYMENADDLETTPATSLNNNPAVTKIGLDMAKRAFSDATNAGLRVNHYGTTVNNPIGRAYFGLFNAVSFLIETRGIGAGRQTFERRVFSQEVAATSYITYAAEHADEIMKAVAAARADVVAKGKTYEESDVLALYQTKSGKTLTDYTAATVQYSVADGSEKVSKASPLSLNDTLTRSRVRPTAYVIPADTANIEKILYIMDNQGAEYYKLNAGTTASLQQYYYVGDYMVNGKAKGIEAGLRDTADVTFASGAYVFPMDQVASNVIAMLCEPDVTDSNGYDGTLYQYKQIDYDKSTMNFPLYRYTGNDPRTTLVSNGTSAEPTQPTQPEKPSQPASSDTYTVVSGDSLWKIASKQLGSGSRWTEIYDLNKDTVKSPSVIFVGQILKMPLTAVSQ